MRDFNIIRSLVGNNVTEDELKYVECYVNDKIGLFIPSMGQCGYAKRENHIHPSYMVTIFFLNDSIDLLPNIEVKNKHYLAAVTSPDVPHSDAFPENGCYYCIMIDSDYFEEQFKMYSSNMVVFNNCQFIICSDILKALNTFAFEYSKGMKNSDVTLSAQATIITHWIIRSILGENLDMRSISANYSVGRIQQYIEQHFGENITVGKLAEMVYLSESTMNRLFKKETGLTPFEYLIETRVGKSKIMLGRKNMHITDIAIRCGFNSNSHFTSCFKRVTGISPSEYRKIHMEH